MISFFKQLYCRALLELDLAIWWYQTTKLRKNQFSYTKVVLVSNLMTTIATSKVEALYVAALRDRGFKIYVLLPTPNSIIQRIFVRQVRLTLSILQILKKSIVMERIKIMQE